MKNEIFASIPKIYGVQDRVFICKLGKLYVIKNQNQII